MADSTMTKIRSDSCLGREASFSQNFRSCNCQRVVLPPEFQPARAVTIAQSEMAERVVLACAAGPVVRNQRQIWATDHLKLTPPRYRVETVTVNAENRPPAANQNTVAYGSAETGCMALCPSQSSNSRSASSHCSRWRSLRSGTVRSSAGNRSNVIFAG